MTTITFQGNPINITGELPKIGTLAPPFTLTKIDLSETKLKDYTGKKIVLNIFPSLDTPTCATSVRYFNEKANSLNNTVILCASMDLPFAQKRFCGSENLSHVIPVSAFRHPEFGDVYGLTITEGPLTGLFSRAIIIINEDGKIQYTERVKELSSEPNYQAALNILL